MPTFMRQTRGDRVTLNKYAEAVTAAQHFVGAYDILLGSTRDTFSAA